MEVIAADLSGASSLNYVNGTRLTIGRGEVVGTGDAALPAVIGIIVSGADRSISVVARTGTLNVAYPVSTVGAGTILLHAEGLGHDLMLNANVSSVTGAITLRASGQVVQAPAASVTTTGSLVIDSQGNLHPVTDTGDVADRVLGAEPTRGLHR